MFPKWKKSSGVELDFHIPHIMIDEQRNETMTRIPGFSNPLMLGFEELERVLDRASKATNDGYPPYNIERIRDKEDGGRDVLLITLAVAGFTDGLRKLS